MKFWTFMLGSGCVLLFFTHGAASAQDVTFTTHVVLHGQHTDAKKYSPKNIVVWLAPMDFSPQQAPLRHFRLVQHNKSFEPHILVVPVGAVVEFPNHDPFFHNVFSLFDGKRFDLGLYEAGSTREVHFDKPGISYIFCNIHAQMSAVVVSVSTPYYAVSDANGNVSIPGVPVGRYKLRIWYEAAPEPLQAITREISISQQDPGIAKLDLEVAKILTTHKNLYGHDYEPPQPSSPAYERP
ncbi:MAG TPA: carboxypeptidase regulatory-like domain-containing protein [Terriglobales bacterium]|nr:carboxypeptidase regulatory-like domain-containing protein [Terriglobales bacterium]